MTYIVRPGDNLWSIAQRFGVTPQAIMLANGITNPNYIYVGQVLIIPTTPTPIPPTTNLEQRVTRLEQQYRQLERSQNQLERRVTRLERGRTGSNE